MCTDFRVSSIITSTNITIFTWSLTQPRAASQPARGVRGGGSPPGCLAQPCRAATNVLAMPAARGTAPSAARLVQAEHITKQATVHCPSTRSRNTTTAKDRPRAVHKSLGCANAHAALLAELAPQRNQQRLAALELGARNDMQPLRLACNAAAARRMRHADGSALLQYAHDDVATPERVLHGQRGGALIATTLAKEDVRSMHASPSARQPLHA